jgi:hypothetical protein
LLFVHKENSWIVCNGICRFVTKTVRIRNGFAAYFPWFRVIVLVFGNRLAPGSNLVNKDVSVVYEVFDFIEGFSSNKNMWYKMTVRNAEQILTIGKVSLKFLQFNGNFLFGFSELCMTNKDVILFSNNLEARDKQTRLFRLRVPNGYTKLPESLSSLA